jgi:hypothetical protein
MVGGDRRQLFLPVNDTAEAASLMKAEIAGVYTDERLL